MDIRGGEVLKNAVSKLSAKTILALIRAVVYSLFIADSVLLAIFKLSGSLYTDPAPATAFAHLDATTN